MKAQQWFEKGNYHRVNGFNIFVIDSLLIDSFDKESSNNMEIVDKPNLCILHGFPTSSFDYHKVLDDLSQHYRVIVFDHLGFGFSDKPINYSYSLIEQADITLALWQALGVRETTILAHDYGTSILTELLARDKLGFCPIIINQIVLCNGSIHIELARLRLMQRLLRHKLIGPWVAKLANKNTLKSNLKNIYYDPSKIDQLEVNEIWDMMNFNQGKRVIAKISRYTIERQLFWFRWVGALQNTQIPIEIIWTDKDPIAVPEMAELINHETKNSRLFWLNNLGHFPMLEDPQIWLTKVFTALKFE